MSESEREQNNQAKAAEKALEISEDLVIRLAENGIFSKDFTALLAAATVIACLGLFQNSPAVIIGAMIVAPLMRPLSALSLFCLTGDAEKIKEALLTLVLGTALALTLAYCIAAIMPQLEMTGEIMGRTKPTLLDLGVAMAAGAIGAYCQSKRNLADSLAGVSIAVALVPPLSCVGIGLNRNLDNIWQGAALLYATNLIGITFAGTVVFYLLGVKPTTKTAHQGLFTAALAVTTLLVPLGFSMRELILENILSGKISNILMERTQTFRSLRLDKVEVLRFKQPVRVLVTVVGKPDAIKPKQVALVQNFLEKETLLKIKLRVRLIAAQEITEVEPLAEEGATAVTPQTEPSSQTESAPSSRSAQKSESTPKSDQEPKPDQLEKAEPENQGQTGTP